MFLLWYYCQIYKKKLGAIFRLIVVFGDTVVVCACIVIDILPSDDGVGIDVLFGATFFIFYNYNINYIINRYNKNIIYLYIYE
jgi:hypothetical protein